MRSETETSRMTIGLTWRRTARRIKRLKETFLTISPLLHLNRGLPGSTVYDLSTVPQPEIRGEISPRIKCSSLRFKCNSLLYLNRGLPGSAVYDLSTVRHGGRQLVSARITAESLYSSKCGRFLGRFSRAGRPNSKRRIPPTGLTLWRNIPRQKKARATRTLIVQLVQCVEQVFDLL